MRGRVLFRPPSSFSMYIHWKTWVEEPLREGYILEAFSSADALIDERIESCLRQIYSDHKCQDLINEIHFLRGRVNFDSLILLEILKAKTVTDESFVQKVRQFKKARNLVLHQPEAEYALIIGNLDKQYSSQEELDNLVKDEAKKWLSTAFDIFVELADISIKIAENEDYYFSGEFYDRNPRGKIAQKKYPKDVKRKN